MELEKTMGARGKTASARGRGAGLLAPPRAKRAFVAVAASALIVLLMSAAGFGVALADTGDDLADVASGQVGNGASGYQSWYSSQARSGDWAWCHIFVSWCAEQVGALGTHVPRTASCQSGMAWYQSNGLWHDADSSYAPRAGDIVYFHTTGPASESHHVGIVTSCSGGRVYTIEGNCSNRVKVNGGYSRGYPQDGSPVSGSTYIMGYGTPWEDSVNHNPEGSLDLIQGGQGSVLVAGWAIDPDDPNAQLDIHVYVGGEGHAITANLYRSDVGYHAFHTTIPVGVEGNKGVEAYAINVGEGGNALIGTGTVDISSAKPVGRIDYVGGGSGTVEVCGWAFDLDDPGASLDVHVYIGGPVGTGSEGYVIRADQPRDDVNQAYGISGSHGFDAVIDTGREGAQDVYIYAINVGYGVDNTCLGHETAQVSHDERLPNYDYGSAVTLPQGDGTYTIASSLDPRLFVEVEGSSGADGANVQLWGGWTSRNRLWRFSRNADGTYTIANDVSGKVLDVYDASLAGGANVQQWADNGSSNQRWWVQDCGDGTYALKAAH